MSCHDCYKAIEDGDIKQLDKLQNECQLYQGNQCNALPALGTLGDDALRASIKAFPDYIKSKLVPLLVLLALVSTLVLVPTPVNAGEDILATSNRVVSDEHRDLQAMSNSELLNYYNQTNSENAGLYIIDRVSKFDVDYVYTNGIEEKDLIIRLQGFVTSVKTDFLFGSYVTVGHDKLLSPHDVRINGSDLLATLGSEVIIYIIPVFISYDTPINTWVWSQLNI